MTKKVEAEREEYRNKLREILKPGDTVYTILRHVSKSGMQREISTVLRGPDGMQDITWLVGQVTGNNFGKHEGLKIGGCGMDMGFALVYELSYQLFPKGFKVEGRGRNGDTSGWDNDGGYALKQRWL